MCVAIYKAKGLSLTDDTLRKCFTSNPDGAGFAYIEQETGELRIQKFMELKPFLTAYREAEDKYKETSPFLVHFRIKTHGQKDIDNCHPFKIDNDHVFIHNGIIKNVPDCPDKKRSDTRMFKELILRQLPEGWFDSPAIKDLIQEFIGSFSKIVVMNRFGEVNIYNEKQGSWIDGVWFSNTLWQPRSSYSWKDDDFGYSWREKKKDKVYTHLDRCISCQVWIRNNVYANTNHVSFCSSACQEAWKKKIAGRSKEYDLCEMCLKEAKFSVRHNKEQYHYCSEACRREHDFDLRKEKNKRAAIDTVECAYCSNQCVTTTCVELEISYGSEYRPVKEYMCVDCIPRAMDSGYIEETPELIRALDKIKGEISLAQGLA